LASLERAILIARWWRKRSVYRKQASDRQSDASLWRDSLQQRVPRLMRTLLLLAREKKKGWCPEPITPILLRVLRCRCIERWDDYERLPKQHLYCILKNKKNKKGEMNIFGWRFEKVSSCLSFSLSFSSAAMSC
jgi:hypothetical protein